MMPRPPRGYRETMAQTMARGRMVLVTELVRYYVPLERLAYALTAEQGDPLLAAKMKALLVRTRLDYEP